MILSHRSSCCLLILLSVCTFFVTSEDNNRASDRQRALLRLDSHCELGSCYPALGDLLVGRQNQLFASSTCGSYRRERYCDISYLTNHQPKCYWCESNNNTIGNVQLNHGIQNVIYKYSGIRDRSWWQSESGRENVLVQLDLEAEFHLEQLIIKFKTFRPKAMVVEISSDFGKTWRVYRYFADNCANNFPGVPEKTQLELTDVVCESRYSGINPANGGEVNFRLLPMYVSPYSEEAQNFLRSTNIRINFKKLHTIGNDILDNRAEIQDKYYYAIEKMTVLGSCFCYGHASRCIPFSGVESNDDSIVHSRCKCAHNTRGLNCEYCADLFNSLPWQPAVGKKSNECKKCTCNDHAIKCHFDAAVFNQSGNVRGGVCDKCQHNTMGIHCERCLPKFYRDPNLEIQDPYICKACDCDSQGVTDSDILCDDETDILSNKTAGRCRCKANVDGLRCDRCRYGFWNFDVANPNGCEECTCNKLGTIDERACDPSNGMCLCKRYVTGRNCDHCLPEFYGLSDTKTGCSPCDCHPSGALDTKCNRITGQCKCRPNVIGLRCDLPL